MFKDAKESEIELTRVKAKRSIVRRAVTNYVKKIEGNLKEQDVNFEEISENLELLKQKEAELKDIDYKVEALIENLEELDSELESVFAYNEKVILIKFRAEKKLNEQKKPELNVSSLNSADKTNYGSETIKLPKLSLPNFSGNIIDWLTFKDLFNATVTKNESLSDAQKLQYLKTSLKGDAAKIVNSIPISDSNFKIAYNLLDERYSNTREQTFAHIKRFLDLQSIQNESASALSTLVDNVNEIIRSLETLGQSVDKFGDTSMLYLILQKLDTSTKLWWERQSKNYKIPKLRDLIEFLKSYARTIQNSKGSVGKVQKPTSSKVNALVAVSVCSYCKDNHYLSKKCKSGNTCFKCGKRHHSMLHQENENRSIPRFPSVRAKEFIPCSVDTSLDLNRKNEVTSIVCANNSYGNQLGTSMNNSNSSVLLCTAVIKIRNSKNEWISCKCLLDTGSEKNFIRKECAKQLGLKINPAQISVSCLGSYNMLSNGAVELVFSSHFDTEFKIVTSAYVIDKICGELPNSTTPVKCFNEYKDLLLADPSYFKKESIDILFGVNVFFSLVNGEVIKRGENLPFAVCSRLGWIIAGATTLSCCDLESRSVNSLSVTTDELVKSFWELEQIPLTQSLTREERLCETHFLENYTCNKEGRYSVRLPFKPNRKLLGNSKATAFKMFHSLEKRLLKIPDIYLQYKKFMTEYLDLGHMEIDNTVCKENAHYCIPHHHVINESSSTTKLRVVFNASAKTTSGVSLNDTLMNGPKVQDDFFAILLRFRCHNIAITSDLQKMYRQIEIHDADRDFQKILWRDDSTKPISTYRLCTVTYGTASARYIATRVLKQLAIDEAARFPKAVDLIMHNFYVDDCLFGAKTQEEAIDLIHELNDLLRRGQFKLHKWCTNNSFVLERLRKSEGLSACSSSTADSKFIKVLGLRWNPTLDDFTYNIHFSDKHRAFPTKRSILSSVSSIFDPLGWLSPFIITAKILIQDLWKCQLSWDDPVPPELKERWINYSNDISQLEPVTVPRRVLLHEASNNELYCFCDGSEKAYAAVIYLKSSDTSSHQVSLLTSKTRVSPLKTISIPRLELCSAVLLVHLLQIVLSSLHIQIDAIHAFTDSTIVLAWLRSEPSRWQIFVANRVSEIQGILPIQHWRWIPSDQNPADCASRGLLPSELLKFELWWSGPHWLRHEEIPHVEVPLSTDALKEERKKASCLYGTLSVDFPIIVKVSSYVKLRHMIAWCLRFIKNVRYPKNRNIGYLTSDEMKAARNILVKIVQKQEFSTEYLHLENKKPLPANSKLLSLKPFINEDGVIRVGGRLENAPFSNERRHPILLPKNHHLTTIIIRSYHETYLHAGTILLLSVIRKEFWTINAKSAIKKEIWKCIKCFKLKGKTATQVMADLPRARVMPSRVFSKTGLDFAGPFLVKPRSGRGVRTLKVYICIFVCLAVKAVHIEIVGKLSADCFIAALKRFVARRGKPSEKEEPVHNYFANEGIKWNFNPPSAPHFGGIWEAAVKSAKSHLKRTIADQKLTLEEFSTLRHKLNLV
ncbi:uncharacterized protein LOC129233424 [Uloborus diversus]|uniref:uncharacterized protein LOC129233424 n=1 Tax=Uloborus diversus TaxID=327109 RepID=UPI0024095B81|nr:uncharacterized protein LOC129233424 [Uloborus diversus]